MLKNTTPLNQNKGKNTRMQNRLIRLIKVVFLKGTMLSVSDKSESVNELSHTDQQKIKSVFQGFAESADKLNR